jgi:putative two-component system response regulator
VNPELDGGHATGVAIAELRILVVDDEPANTILLAGMLRRWGFTNVVSITDPTRVVDAFTQGAPDLLLLDVGMPVLSGFDVMGLLEGWLHSDTPVPVVVLTADVTDATKHRALECGARDFLTKPFDPEEVRLRVSNLLELRLLQRQIKSHSDDLEERVQRRTHQLELSRLELVHRLAAAAEYRDDDTHQHAHRIGRTAGLLAASASASRRLCMTSARSRFPTPSCSSRESSLRTSSRRYGLTPSSGDESSRVVVRTCFGPPPRSP